MTPSTDLTAITSDNRKFVFDFDKINTKKPTYYLSPTWGFSKAGKTIGIGRSAGFVLGMLPYIAINHLTDRPCSCPLRWFDTITGKSSEGAISLVAHIEQVPEYEAALILVGSITVSLNPDPLVDGGIMFFTPNDFVKESL